MRLGCAPISADREEPLWGAICVRAIHKYSYVFVGDAFALARRDEEKGCEIYRAAFYRQLSRVALGARESTTNAINIIVDTSFDYRSRDLQCSQTKCLKPSLDYFPMFESFIVASHAA